MVTRPQAPKFLVVFPFLLGKVVHDLMRDRDVNGHRAWFEATLSAPGPRFCHFSRLESGILMLRRCSGGCDDMTIKYPQRHHLHMFQAVCGRLLHPVFNFTDSEVLPVATYRGLPHGVIQ